LLRKHQDTAGPVREAVRRKHYCLRTEGGGLRGLDQALFLFHSKRHPNKMGGVEAESLMTHVAAREHIAASTQNQALGALSGATHLTCVAPVLH